jgi:hypothetical protein
MNGLRSPFSTPGREEKKVMANCDRSFLDYLEVIRIGAAKKASLRTSRNANRERICKYFRDTLGRDEPRFHGQGSYKMFTMINPLDGDYDIDDGVYLQGLAVDQSKWPTADTVHSWIVKAVEGYTSIPPQDKARCVRVRYSGDYHVDLPIYAENALGVPMLFEKGKAPYESDPKAFTSWFLGRVKDNGEQLRRLVMYLKGWRDKQQEGLARVTGLSLTILAANNFKSAPRDDIALVETVSRICTQMGQGGGIRKPVTPREDLAANWSPSQRSNFVEKLGALRDRGGDALAEEDEVTASRIWRRQFGDRFPVVETTGQTKGRPIRTAAPAILGYDGRSA